MERTSDAETGETLLPQRTSTPVTLGRIQLTRRDVGETLTAQVIILHGARTEHLSNDISPEMRRELATLYATEWSREGVQITEDDASQLFESLDLSETFVVKDTEGRVCAMVNTVPVNEPNLKALMRRFPTYKSIEEESVQQKANPAKKTREPKFRICFSIVARRDNGTHLRIQNGTGTHSLSRFLLNAIPGDRTYKVAFSRMGGINTRNVTATRHFLSIRDRRDATSMHEQFGGTVVAIVEESRPEDTDGGGANTWVIYAKAPRILPNPEPRVIETIPTANGGSINILDNYDKIVL